MVACLDDFDANRAAFVTQGCSLPAFGEIDISIFGQNNFFMAISGKLIGKEGCCQSPLADADRIYHKYCAFGRQLDRRNFKTRAERREP